MSVGPSSRSVALEVIRRVVDEGAYSNRLVPALLSRSGLDSRDRAFAAELSYGTLRHLPRLDHAIGKAATRTVERITPAARNVLRLGAYQLLIAGVAPHAAVGETVALAQGAERGFVNAVLRKLAATPPPLPPGGGDGDVAVRTGVSAWAVRELRALLGDEAEDAAGALAARAPLTLRASGTRADLESALRGAGLDPRPAPHDPACLLLDGGDPARLPGFAEGAFAVQDQASAFVVRTLDPQPGERVLDVCAAPGGKALMAAQLVEPDGLVVAADAREFRMGLVAREASRLRVHPLLVVQDATAPAVRGLFARILVDAPCSGIGSARRRPELLWRVRKDRVGALAAAQLAILGAAADLLAPGGRLVYSVCTFPRAETDAVLDTILRQRPDLRAVATRGPEGIAERHRLWPHRHGTDGMFVAALTTAA